MVIIKYVYLKETEILLMLTLNLRNVDMWFSIELIVHVHGPNSGEKKGNSHKKICL